ncbi:MAG: hypothetical protein WAT58_06015, partial [Candidatus Dormiibacterota bacterium]
MTKSGVSEHTTWGRRALRLCIAASSLALASAALIAVPASAATAATTTACPAGTAAVTSYFYTANGNPAHVALDGVSPGDKVTAHFTIAPNCTGVQVSFVSYNADPNDLGNLSKQTVFSQATGTFASGDQTLVIDIPCAWQADLVTGAVITKFDESTGQTYSAQNRLINAGSNKGICVTPSPTPTGGESPAASPTSSVNSATTGNPNSSVLG